MNNFGGKVARLRANLYLPMKQPSASAATCPIYMTKVAISQKKVFDNFYQIPPSADDELCQTLFTETMIRFSGDETFVSAQKFRTDYMWAQAFKTFYRLHDLATDWDQSRQICEAEGTSLLVPDTLEEMENLKLLISNMKAPYTAIFIGVHDQFSDGDYITVKGEPIKDTILELLWGEGRPNNVNGSEHCIVMTREGLLDDRPCKDIYPFVCKILGNETKYNEKCNNFDTEYNLQSNGKCYKFHVEPLSWHDAYLVCKFEEGRLAIINSPKEASLVVGFLGEHLNSNTPDPNILYIGFSDLMFPYQYRTITGDTLEEAGYSSWSPLKEDVDIEKTKRCGAISRTGFLEVAWCDQPAMFLCEKVINKS